MREVFQLDFTPQMKVAKGDSVQFPCKILLVYNVARTICESSNPPRACSPQPKRDRSCTHCLSDCPSCAARQAPAPCWDRPPTSSEGPTSTASPRSRSAAAAVGGKLCSSRPIGRCVPSHRHLACFGRRGRATARSGPPLTLRTTTTAQPSSVPARGPSSSLAYSPLGFYGSAFHSLSFQCEQFTFKIGLIP